VGGRRRGRRRRLPRAAPVGRTGDMVPTTEKTTPERVIPRFTSDPCVPVAQSVNAGPVSTPDDTPPGISTAPTIVSASRVGWNRVPIAPIVARRARPMAAPVTATHRPDRHRPVPVLIDRRDDVAGTRRRGGRPPPGLYRWSPPRLGLYPALTSSSSS